MGTKVFLLSQIVVFKTLLYMRRLKLRKLIFTMLYYVRKHRSSVLSA